jgi:hypothetical protein
VIASASQFIQLRLSPDPDQYHRAAHEEAALATWQDLISNHQEMRFWVAQNKTVPVAILEQLADDEDATVREMVAAKRKLPERLQLKLAFDADPTVRGRLAYNAKAAMSTLHVLADDRDQDIRTKALERLATIAALDAAGHRGDLE